MPFNRETNNVRNLNHTEVFLVWKSLIQKLDEKGEIREVIVDYVTYFNFLRNGLLEQNKTIFFPNSKIAIKCYSDNEEFGPISYCNDYEKELAQYVYAQFRTTFRR